MNKLEIARRFGCSWKTVDRKINPAKYAYYRGYSQEYL